MSKSLAVVALLLAVALIALPLAHGRVGAYDDRVYVTELDTVGDPAAAEGVELAWTVAMGNRLFWHSRFAAGAEPRIETDFAFYQSEQNYDHSFAASVAFTFYSDGGIGSTGGIDLEEEAAFGFMLRPAAAVAGRTASGETRTERVWLRDYYEFYPMTIDIYAPGARYGSEEQQEAAGEYFRFPVRQDHLMEVTVTKDSAGRIVEVQNTTVSGGLWSNSCYWAVTDAGCYLTLPVLAEEGNPLDVSHLPEGFGIFYMPFIEGPAPEGIPLVSLAYPLDEQTDIRGLTLSADGQSLLLFTVEEDHLVMTVIDIATLEAVQRLTVLANMEDCWLDAVWVREGFALVTLTDGRFALLAGGAGEYAVWLADTVPQEHEAWRYLGGSGSDGPAMAFDGDRLAMATFIGYRNTCEVYLAVYRADGLHYAARLANSLEDAVRVPYEYRYRVEPWPDTPLAISMG